MTPLVRAALVSSAMVGGLALERWRGAPWMAIAITAGIALPMVNGLMFWKQSKQQKEDADVTTENTL